MESIFTFIEENLNDEGFLDDSCVQLPDCESMSFEERNNWRAGAFEGNLLRSFDKIKPWIFTTHQISVKVKKYVNDSTDSNKLKMREALLRYPAIAIADPVISFMESYKIDKTRLKHIADDLAHENARELVKMGIALLGYCGDPEMLETVKLLSKHEEFTLYGAVAIGLIAPSGSDEILYNLAKYQRGWGRIALINEIRNFSPEMQSWLLREGCRNSIGAAYLAKRCAVKGRLADALEADIIDEELYKGAAYIMEGLTNNDKINDGMREYDDALRAVKSFLRHSETRDSNENKDLIFTLKNIINYE